MDLNDAAQEWQTRGFAVLLGLIPVRELAAAWVSQGSCSRR
jgi:hypothetical protein